MITKLKSCLTSGSGFSKGSHVLNPISDSITKYICVFRRKVFANFMVKHRDI